MIRHLARIAALAALGTALPAAATDMSSYPESVLGPVSRVASTLPGGVLQCQLSGSFDYVGVRVEYVAQSRLIGDGIKDAGNFGHYRPGSNSFTTFRIPDATTFRLPDWVPATSCQRKLDLEASQYTMNRARQGMARLVVLADPANPDFCPALTGQWTFIADNEDNFYLTSDDSANNGGMANHLASGQCRRP